MIFGKQVRPFEPKPLNDASNLGKDTHVTRQGRDLIRKTLEDANVPVSVSLKGCLYTPNLLRISGSSWRYKLSMLLSETSIQREDGTPL